MDDFRNWIAPPAKQSLPADTVDLVGEQVVRDELLQLLGALGLHVQVGNVAVAMNVAGIGHVAYPTPFAAATDAVFAIRHDLPGTDGMAPTQVINADRFGFDIAGGPDSSNTPFYWIAIGH